MNLARLIEQSRLYSQMAAEGDRNLPSLTVLCRESPSDHEAVVYDPVICLILQGAMPEGW